MASQEVLPILDITIWPSEGSRSDSAGLGKLVCAGRAPAGVRPRFATAQLTGHPRMRPRIHESVLTLLDKSTAFAASNMSGNCIRVFVLHLWMARAGTQPTGDR